MLDAGRVDAGEVLAPGLRLGAPRPRREGRDARLQREAPAPLPRRRQRRRAAERLRQPALERDPLHPARRAGGTARVRTAEHGSWSGCATPGSAWRPRSRRASSRSSTARPRRTAAEAQGLGLGPGAGAAAGRRRTAGGSRSRARRARAAPSGWSCRADGAAPRRRGGARRDREHRGERDQTAPIASRRRRSSSSGGRSASCRRR